jgi:hypothetical protein
VQNNIWKAYNQELEFEKLEKITGQAEKQISSAKLTSSIIHKDELLLLKK